LLALPLSGILSRGAVKLVVYIGIGGVFGVLIGVLLITAGIAVWVSPAHRVFYGVAGVVLGLASFPASNLGGFFLCMLLAIVGGSIAFAWAPISPLVADSPPVPASPPVPESHTMPDAPTVPDLPAGLASPSLPDEPPASELPEAGLPEGRS
jgi:hypothetical protein